MTRIITRSLLVFVAILTVAFWILLSSSLGLRLLAGSVPGLSFSTIEGRLMDSVHVWNLNFKSKQFDLSVQEGLIKWRPLDLLSGLINISSLKAKGCKVVYKTAKASSSPVSLPQIRLPLKIALHNTKIVNISIFQDNSHKAFQKAETISLDLGFSRSDLRIDRFRVNMGQAAFALSGTVKVSGDYPFHLITSVKYVLKGYPPVAFSGSLDGTYRKILIDQKFRSPARGKLHAVVTNVLDKPHWDAMLTTTNLSLKQIPSVGIPVVVGGQVSSRGGVDSFDLIGNIQGSGYGYDHLSGNFALSRQGKVWALSKAVISIPGRPRPTTIEASGKVDEKMDIAWKVDLANLGTFIPGMHGSAVARGSLKGPKASPELIASATGAGIAYEKYKTASIKADVKLDFRDASVSGVSVEAKNIRIQNQEVGSLNLRGSGKVTDHRLTAVLTKDKQPVISLALSGDYREGRWHGILKNFEVFSPLVGHWMLDDDAALDISKTGVRIDPVCLGSEKSRLCATLSAQQPDRDIHVDLAATDILLSSFRSYLPKKVDLGGTFDGKAVVDVHNGKISANMSFVTAKGRLGVPITQKTSKSFNFDMISVNGQFKEDVLHADFKMKLTDGSYAKGDLILPSVSLADFSADKQLVNGTIQAEIKEIAFLAPLLPGTVDLDGTLRTDLTLGGTFGNPDISGSASLVEASADIMDAGIKLEKGSMKINAHGTTLNVTGSAVSGKGSIALDGVIDLAAVDKPFRIHIKGNDFQVASIPELHAVASPDIEIKGQGKRIDVRGSVLIPQAEFKPNDHEGAVRPSEDVVIMGESKEEDKKSKTRVFSDVRVKLGDSVNFDGFGLKGKVGGDVRVVDVPGKPTIGSGEFRITKGQYKLYGVILTIDNGRLYFASSPISNPLLDIRAFRKVGDVTAGAAVEGTLAKPKVTLYSSPEMENSEILSYLIIGSPLQSASQTEGGVVYNAAKSLSLSGGEFIAQKIGSLFGLKQVSIEKGAQPNQESLVIGKYLSPRTYISYGIGIFDPVSTVNLKYWITKKIILMIESGVQKGSDLIYTFERK